MKYLFTIILLSFLTSCFDRTKFEDVSNATLKAVMNNDTTKLKGLFIYSMDSIEQDRKIRLLTQFSEFKDKDYSFLKTDTNSIEILDYKLTEIITYFKIDTNFYSINTPYIKDKKGEIFLDGIGFEKLTENCNSWNKEPYCPKDEIKFKRLSWTTNFGNKSFKSGKVLLENQLNTDIDYIKFRIILKNKYETIFNQTVIYKEKIFAGDITSIDVPGMTDLYTGFLILSDNMQFEAELIEVLPKPESSDCKKIQDLKAIK